MKASELILGTVADARKLDRDTYAPRSDNWHRPCVSTDFVGRETHRECRICFAGAWLTRHFEPTQTVNYDALPRSWASTCSFLDRIRLREFKGIRLFAGLAGIDNSDILERDLIAIHMHTDEFRTQLGGGFAFNSWQTFDDFLGQMERLGRELSRRGL